MATQYNRNAPFSVDLDIATRTLEVTLHGLWDFATAQAYGTELSRAAGRLRQLARQSGWLIDLRDFPVQPSEVANYMSQILPNIIPPLTRVAMVTAAALSAIQSKRVAPGQDHYVFSTIDAARAWLTDQPLA